MREKVDHVAGDFYFRYAKVKILTVILKIFSVFWGMSAERKDSCMLKNLRDQVVRDVLERIMTDGFRYGGRGRKFIEAC